MTVKCDVSCSMCTSNSCITNRADKPSLAELFDRFEFRAWRRELGDDSRRFAPPYRSAGARIRDACCNRSSSLHGSRSIDAAELVSVDTETTSFDPLVAELVGISLAVERARPPTFRSHIATPARRSSSPFEATLARLKPWLEDPPASQGRAEREVSHARVRQSRHRAARYRATTRCWNPTCSRATGRTTWTAWRSAICGLKTHQLTRRSAARALGRSASIRLQLERATQYSAEDADITLQLHRTLLSRDRATTHRLSAHLSPDRDAGDAGVLFDMERHGVLLDSGSAGSAEPRARQADARDRAAGTRAGRAAVQPQFAQQIQEILFEKHKLPVLKKTPSGQPSTDEDVLQELALNYPLPKLILDYRSSVEAEEHLHRQAAAHGQPAHRPGAHQLRAGGGGNRTTVQQRPEPAEHPDSQRRGPAHSRGIHRAARAPYRVGRLLADRAAHHGASVAGCEPAGCALPPARTCIAAPPPKIFARDPGAGHQRAAPLRQGDQLRPDLRHVGVRAGDVSSASSAAPLSSTWTATSRAIPAWRNYMQRTRESRASKGYVETVFGRRLYMIDINASNGQRRQAAERAAINAPMQGTAADLIKLAMIAVQRWLRQRKLRYRAYHAGARRAGAGGARSELALVTQELPRTDDRRRAARRAAGGGRRRGRQLGPGALSRSAIRRSATELQFGLAAVPPRANWMRCRRA